MVSSRCKLLVEKTLQDQGLKYRSVDLGVVHIVGNISSDQRSRLAKELISMDLELINDKKIILVEKIKNIIITLVHFTQERLNRNFSDYLSEKLNYSYTYLSNLFSRKENTTIERYIIKQKIERVKELIVYDELTLTEIAFQLRYSSVAHLSGQFKKVTGMTPSDFKRLRHKRRIEREYVGIF